MGTNRTLEHEYKITDKRLGAGAFGSVFKGVHTPTGQPVAVKTMRNIFDSKCMAQSLLREMMLSRLLFSGHPNMVSLKHIHMPSSRENFNRVSLIFNYRETTLEKILASGQDLTTPHIQFFLRQILSALRYIHSTHSIHRDLKPANILVNSDCSIQICDFGSSRASHVLPCLKEEVRKIEKESKKEKLKEKPAESEEEKQAPLSLSRRLSIYVTTRWYRAPEVLLKDSEYTSAIDMWAVGCILAEMLMNHLTSTIPKHERQALFPGDKSATQSGGDTRNLNEQLRLIFDQIGTPSPEDLKSIKKDNVREYLKKLPQKKPKGFQKKFGFAGKEAVSLLSQLLTFNPEKRLTAAEALSHPFFNSWLKTHGPIKGENLTLPLSSLTTDGTLTEKGRSLLDYYQFERSKPATITMEEYRALILKEIDHYQTKTTVEEQKQVTPQKKKEQTDPPVTTACTQTSSLSKPVSPRAASSLFNHSSRTINPPPRQSTGPTLNHRGISASLS